MKIRYVIWNGKVQEIKADRYRVEGVSQHGMAVTFYRDGKAICSLANVQSVTPVRTEVENVPDRPEANPASNPW